MLTSIRSSLVYVCLALVCFALPPSARAQQQQQQQQPDDDDDATVQPAEPDYRLINLPTTLRLPKFKGNFELTHRFGGNLEEGDFGDQLANLFGMDQGAAVGLEFRFAVAKHIQAVVYRTSFEKDIWFYGKYDAIHQDEKMPVSISALLGVEGNNNFQQDYMPSLGAVISRNFADRVAAYATPIWVHNTAWDIGANRDTFMVGVGARWRFLSKTYVSAEVTPRVAGYKTGQTEYGFGIEERVGGHFFQLNFTNSQTTTFGQIARGGLPSTLYLGFNLARKFY